MLKVFLAGVLLVLIAAGPAAAQGGLDPNAAPAFGQAVVSPGFLPDPYIVTVVKSAPGTIDLSTQNLGSDCVGFAESAPDYQLNWSATSNLLRIFFVGVGDTTLAVSDPTGAWHCNDDSSGTVDPAIEFANPAPGRYSIWVGGLDTTTIASGYLMFTETDSTPASIDSPILLVGSGSSSLPPSTSDSSLPDISASPRSGSTDLAAGFSPDPFSITLSGGGTNDLNSATDFASNCAGYVADGLHYVGYVATAPDYQVNWSGASAVLRIFFVSASMDATLIVYDPAGNWYCNDNFNDFSPNPMVDIANPASGQYDIWVGNSLGPDSGNGTLYISGGTTADPSTVPAAS
jgi:hypothetical protein